ncbi:hypothetical protein ACVWY0_002551 [Arthrobacter sp. UYNi723]
MPRSFRPPAQSRASGFGSANGVLIDAIASGSPQRIPLEVKVLVPRGDPGVSDAVDRHPGGPIFRNSIQESRSTASQSRTICENTVNRSDKRRRCQFPKSSARDVQSRLHQLTDGPRASRFGEDFSSAVPLWSSSHFVASVLELKKRVGQGRFCTPSDQLASIRSTGLMPSSAMREAAHRMVKTERACRLRDSVVVMSTNIGYSDRSQWRLRPPLPLGRRRPRF